MILKNIHSRKDFVKTYEIFGGTTGGVGANDGFANNAKLKDTLLGKLINGIFRGVGWLWRKSKENFIINRLIAQLVNELMRGIILFCFDNNITLKDGKQTKTEGEEEIKTAEGTESQDENILSASGATAAVSGTTTLSREDLIKKIEAFKLEIGEDTKKIQLLESKIKQLEYNINIGTYTIKEKKVKEALLIKLKDELIGQQEGLKIDQDEISKLKLQLKGMTVKKPKNIVNFEKIEQICADKYDFIPTSENIRDEAKSLDAITYPEFTANFKRIKSKYIKIGEKYSAVINGKIETIKVVDVDTSKNIITYNLNGVNNVIKDIKLLPDGFPSFKEIKDNAEIFLSKYFDMYDTMSDENKKKIEVIYMNYSLVNAMRAYEKSTILESIEYLNEENLIRSVGSDIASAGSVKIKPEEPKAGQVNLGRSIDMKLGKSATVGDILTKRDKEKYKEKSEEFKFDIHDVNLAELEKTIQELDKNNVEGSVDTKQKVSTYVNPYNLKTIQLSAEELLLPIKNETGTDNNTSLRLKWNKEVTNTYAAFTNIMNIEKVNIIKDDFGAKLNNDKIGTSGKKLTTILQAQQTIGEMQNNLPLEKVIVNFSKMKDGLWCYYSFLFNSKPYNTSIAPVADAFNNGVGLFQVTSSFDSVDKAMTKVTPNNDMISMFSSKSSDINKTNISKVNVYFLIKNNQIFPQTTKPINFKIFVLNEYIYGDGTSSIFLKKKNNDQPQNIVINNNILTKFDKTKYLYNIDTILCANFDKNNFEKWKDSFNLSNSSSDINFNNFQVGQRPKFLPKDNKMMSLLQNISKYLD